MSELVGQELPNVTLASSEGGQVTLPADIKGKWTIMYFYPKDDTPGCTKQACSYRDNISQFTEIGDALEQSADQLGVVHGRRLGADHQAPDAAAIGRRLGAQR